MIRFFIILIFISSSIGLLRADDKCTLTFSYKTKNLTWSDSTVTADAQSDVIELKTAYKCAYDASKKLPALPTTDPETGWSQYQESISNFLAINYYAEKILKPTLEKLKTDTDSNSKTRVSNDRLKSVGTNTISNTKQLADLKTAITDVTTVATNSSTMASALTGQYDAAKQKAPTKVKDMVVGSDLVDNTVENKLKTNEDFKPYLDDQSNKDKSLLSKMAESKKDANGDAAKEEEKLKTTLIGDYSKPDKIKDFQTKLANNEYDIKTTTTPPPTTPTKIDQPPVTTTTTTAATTNPQGLDKLTSDQLNQLASTTTDPATLAAISDAKNKLAMQDQMNAMQQTLAGIQKNESLAPASSTSNTPSSSSAGTPSSTAPAPLDLQREAEKKKFLEMAKRREDSMAQSEMKSSLKSGRGLGKLSFLKGASLSLRDFFGGKSYDETTPTTTEGKKLDKDKALAFLDEDSKGAGDDKYKKYYKMGKGPDDFSSKDLFKNQFDSMYEAARIKALTEDANTEFAGRYVDLLLLVHSIIDDYYRRGMLVDTTEVIKPVELRK